MILAEIVLVIVVFSTSGNLITSAQTYQQQQPKSQIMESSQPNSEESLLLLLSSELLLPPSQPDESGKKIPNQYLIVLKGNSSQTPAQAADEARDKGAQVLHVYDHALKGFAIKVPNDRLFDAITKNNPNIDYVERDTTAQAHDQTCSGVPVS